MNNQAYSHDRAMSGPKFHKTRLKLLLHQPQVSLGKEHQQQKARHLTI